MTDDAKPAIARRPFIAGVVAIFGAAIAGAVFELPRLFGHRYPQTPYDDLLARLGNRDGASRLGAAILRDDPKFDLQASAGALRSELAQQDLAVAIQGDLIRNRMTEAEGWILPGTLARLCEVAAKAS